MRTAGSGIEAETGFWRLMLALPDHTAKRQSGESIGMVMGVGRLDKDLALSTLSRREDVGGSRTVDTPPKLCLQKRL
jgi:hypothetical protein